MSRMNAPWTTCSSNRIDGTHGCEMLWICTVPGLYIHIEWQIRRTKNIFKQKIYIFPSVQLTAIKTDRIWWIAFEHINHHARTKRRKARTIGCLQAPAEPLKRQTSTQPQSGHQNSMVSKPSQKTYGNSYNIYGVLPIIKPYKTSGKTPPRSWTCSHQWSLEDTRDHSPRHPPKMTMPPVAATGPSFGLASPSWWSTKAMTSPK